MRTSSLVALALSTALVPAAAHAQYRTGMPAQSVQPLTTADQLAAVMRRVAAAPTDVYALVSAGELSFKLDDMSAAAAFFARAEKIDPRNGQVKAGMGAILLRAERPGEALRYFQMAESFGHPASRFAADRGLAFDLLGEQERAQRDYRLALRTAADDETVRRYALSLGISGRQALALQQLDPLTKRQDRAAWRVRAFVLAMNGDVAGASTIATTMMPRGMAGGLQPFFERLPSLAAVDRAFAVHFGEVRPTPARIADARLKPALAALGPDPYAPVQVAAVSAPVTSPAARPGRARARGQQLADRRVAARPTSQATPRIGRPEPRAAVPAAPRTEPPAPSRTERVEVASAATETMSGPAAAALEALAQGGVAPATAGQIASTSPQPSAVAAPPPRPVVLASTATPTIPASAALSGAIVARPSFPSAVTASSVVNSAPALPPVAQASVPAAAPVQVASTVPLAPSALAQAASLGSIVGPPVGLASSSSATPTPMTEAGSATVLQPSSSGITLATPEPVRSPPGAPFGQAAEPPVALAAAPSAGVLSAAGTPVSVPSASPGFASLAAAPAVGAAPVEVASTTPAPPATAVRSEDSILARIVASITIPGAELGVVEPGRRVPPPAAIDPGTARMLAAGEAKAAVEAVDRAVAVSTIAAARKPAAEPVAATRKARASAVGTADATKQGTGTRRGDRTELAAKGRPVVTIKPATAAEKRAADRKKAADDKAALAKAEQAKAKGDPERIWVQVAGGASEGDLPKAWTAAQRKAAALKGRAAYVTPLRATNRVVTGPFKTAAEARAFVNQLARQGVSAFQFTSETGQKMTKLSPK